MIIMGIDSSTTSTGWGIIDTNYDGELRLCGYGAIKPPKKLESIDKIIYIVNELKRIIDEYKPEFVVIEELNVTRNMKTVRILTGLITSIEIMLRKKQALYTKLTPSQWRSKIGIVCKYRTELKQESINYVFDKYEEEVSDDEADAICIAEAGSKLEVEYE